MTNGDSEDDRLREAFAQADSLPGLGEACPPPERLWDSARGALAARENERIVRHLAGCAACATSWRLAREVAGVEPALAPAEAPRRLDWRVWAPLAAAAVLIVAIGLTFEAVSTRRGASPAYRAEEGTWIEPEEGSPGAMARDRFVLRWTLGPQGSTYDVRVVAADGRPVARGLRIDRPEFEVPASALAGLPRGAKIFWQVTAYLPDGRVSDSPTFIVRIE